MPIAVACSLCGAPCGLFFSLAWLKTWLGLGSTRKRRGSRWMKLHQLLDQLDLVIGLCETSEQHKVLIIKSFWSKAWRFAVIFWVPLPPTLAEGPRSPDFCRPKVLAVSLAGYLISRSNCDWDNDFLFVLGPGHWPKHQTFFQVAMSLNGLLVTPLD